MAGARGAARGGVIVDGNNVLGSRPDGWWRDRAGATRRLVERLGAAGEELVVVFDGPRPPGLVAPPGLDVRFAPNADDMIAALVAAAPDAERVQVVTSDRGLARRVRAHGAQVVGARAFRDRIDPPLRQDGGR
jgi:predicted RNA-binding protein with PIN domain